MKKICIKCGNEFETYTPHRRICSICRNLKTPGVRKLAKIKSKESDGQSVVVKAKKDMSFLDYVKGVNEQLYIKLLNKLG